jgi:hypothetical protein
MLYCVCNRWGNKERESLAFVSQRRGKNACPRLARRQRSHHSTTCSLPSDLDAVAAATFRKAAAKKPVSISVRKPTNTLKLTIDNTGLIPLNKIFLQIAKLNKMATATFVFDGNNFGESVGGGVRVWWRWKPARGFAVLPFSPHSP